MTQSLSIDLAHAQRDELADRLATMFRAFELQTGLQVNTVSIRRASTDVIDAVVIDVRLALPRARLCAA